MERRLCVLKQDTERMGQLKSAGKPTDTKAEPTRVTEEWAEPGRRQNPNIRSTGTATGTSAQAVTHNSESGHTAEKDPDSAKARERNVRMHNDRDGQTARTRIGSHRHLLRDRVHGQRRELVQVLAVHDVIGEVLSTKPNRNVRERASRQEWTARSETGESRD